MPRRVPENTDANSARRTGPIRGADGRVRGGNPGNKGGSGRPPNAYRDFVRKLLESPKARKALKTVLEDDTHPAYSAVWKAAAERAHGKAVQPISGADGEGPVAHTVTITRRIVRPTPTAS